MAEENKNMQTDSAADAEKTLDRILQLSAEMNQIRKRQTWFNVLGVVVIVVILGAFIGKLIDFGKKFDTAAFAGYTAKEASALLKDENVAMLQKDFTSVFLPELQKQFQQKLNAKLPDIKESVSKETRVTINFVANDISEKVKKDLETQLNEMLVRIFQKNGADKLSSEDIENAVKAVKEKTLAAVADSMKHDMTKARNSLRFLNDTLQDYKNLPEYQKIQRMESDEVQTQLVESFLELWIYSIDPVRGDAPVDANGGI